VSLLSRTLRDVLPEADISVLCARRDGDEALRARPDKPLDWAKVLQYAQIHGVLQFVAAALERDAVQIPEPWKSIVAAQHRRNVTRAMMQFRECGAIVTALAQADIRAVPFKGTSLSKLLYGRVADRVSSDIDILVRERDFRRAREVTERLGYVAADESAQLDLETLLSSGNEMIFRNSRGIIAELHWRLFERDRACSFATRLEDLHVAEGRIEDEDLFLLLALHGLTHRWETLKWIVDIDAFVRNVPTRWDVIFARAADSGTLRPARIALLLAHRVLGTPLPLPIDDQSAFRIAILCERALLTGAPISPVADFWLQIVARERWIDRIRFVRFVARPQPWDHAAPSAARRLSRWTRLLLHRRRPSQLADVQKIPELRTQASDEQ
jgi:putative nucleotidyltransferase-like protein